MRKEFEMTDAQFQTLIEASKPVPLIATNCGMPSSPQENANRAWENLGKELGFDYTTVAPVSGKGPKFFTAEAIDEAG